MSSDGDDITFHLSRLKVPHEVRALKVGDYLWVARDRRNTVELVLPYVIERKRIDDFGSSIMDGRYNEQKFRLQQSGVQNIVYLIESFEDIQSSVPALALRQATVNTLVQCGIQVKLTDSLRTTAHYLSCMSQVLHKLYNVSCVNFSLSSQNDIYAMRCVRRFFPNVPLGRFERTTYCQVSLRGRETTFTSLNIIFVLRLSHFLSITRKINCHYNLD